jgi:hypoxanthine phosphoribosyltransferase
LHYYLWDNTIDGEHMNDKPNQIQPSATPELASVLVTRQQIAERVGEMAEELAQFYQGREVTIVQVLTGALMFVADLVRQMPLSLRIESVSVSSYRGTNTRPGQARFRLPPPEDLSGRDVLIVDDIYDSGQTMAVLIEAINQSNPTSLRQCVLLQKDRPDLPARPGVDFVGFDIPDEFVVGYGLDYDGLYRNLPDIGVLAQELREEQP